MFKSEYEKRMERVAAIKEQIANQSDVAHKAANAAADHMIALIEKHMAGGGDLQKLAGPLGLVKSANAKARAEMEALNKLKIERVDAQARANEEFESYATYISSMQSQTPSAGSRYFSVIKGGKVTPLETPAAEPAVDLNRALFETSLARRFPDGEQQQ
jgi:hypothetical protein